MVLIGMQSEDGEKFIGRERTQKEISLCAEVVNQLAADSAMHSKISQIMNHDARAVFAEAVGEDAVGAVRSPEICDRWANGFDNTKGLNRDRTRPTVVSFDGDSYEVRIGM